MTVMTMMMMNETLLQAVVLAGGFFVVFWMLMRYMRHLTTPLLKVPGPSTPSFFLGCLPIIRREPYMQAVIQWWREAGQDESTPFIHYQLLFGSSTLVVLDKDIVKKILTAPAGNAENEIRFQKRTEFVGNRLGQGLVTVQGHVWSRHRKIIQPAFHVGFLKQALGTSVPPRVSAFVESWSKVAGSGREILLSSHLSALTLDIIGDVAFSHEFDALEKVEKWCVEGGGADIDGALDEIDDPLLKSVGQLGKPSILTIILFTMRWSSIDRYLNPATRHLRNALEDAANTIVENAKQNTVTDEQPKSLLKLLLQARQNDMSSSTITSMVKGKASERTLTDSELRDEMKTFIAAGHETTSTLCYWAIYALSTNPHIQDRLYEELSETGELDVDGVEQLEYLDAFIHEVLRFHPPVGAMLRYNRSDENLAGYAIPAGTQMIVSPYLLHRNPRYWKDPDQFSPERWIHSDAASRQAFQEKTRFAYIPFSAGGRNCIGQRFAMIEAKLIVSSLIKAFDFKIAPSQREVKFELRGIGIPKLRPGLKVAIEARS